ncbi:MAG: aminopeptidase [Clostridia bacterium]|nr:aminopeptidase [Clostridia bacterium]
MKTFEEKTAEYAALLVKEGLALQESQVLVISAQTECAPFVRTVAREAYRQGAKEVVCLWNDEILSQMAYAHAPLEVFETVPDWRVESRMHYVRQGACFLSLCGGDPDLLARADPQKLSTANRVFNAAYREYYANTMANRCRWCVAGVPTRAWAEKVFGADEASIQKLWQAIFNTVRISEDGSALEAWRAHTCEMARREEKLNRLQFDRLIYRNARGTNFTVGLPENHVWAGGAEKAADGITFSANIPTEEMFTAPHRLRAEGTLVSALPLSYNGVLIDGFTLKFHNGEVVKYSAEVGLEALERLLNSCPGMKMLGEVALVPHCSPIAQMGVLFYNTLYDENASCHFALGASYPSCVDRGTELGEEEQLALGLNQAEDHVDFMIGTEDLVVEGITKNGETVVILRNGRFEI